jgi:hypothetical protein
VFGNHIYSVTSTDTHILARSLAHSFTVCLLSGFKSVSAMLVARFKLDGNGIFTVNSVTLCLLGPGEQAHAAKFKSSHQFCSNRKFELRQNKCVTQE